MGRYKANCAAPLFSDEALSTKTSTTLTNGQTYNGKAYTDSIYIYSPAGYCSKWDVNVQAVQTRNAGPGRVGDFEEPHADYIWDISQDLMEKFKNCSPRRYFDSKPFSVGSREDLKWYLRAYPNGLDENDEGDFRLFLNLASGLKRGQSVLVCCYLGCKHVNQPNLSTFIASHCWLTKYMMTENRSIVCKSDDGWDKWTLCLSQVLKSHSYSFFCALRILRICDVRGGISYEYPLNLGDFDRRDKMEWNISPSLTHKILGMTTTNDLDDLMEQRQMYFPPLSSVMMNSMFYLSVYTERDDSGLSLFVNMFTLPIGVQYADIAAVAYFVPLGKWCVADQMGMHYDLRRERGTSCIRIDVCNAEEWSSVKKIIDNQLNVEVTVTIMKMYDANMKEVVIPKTSDYVLTLKANQEYKENGDYSHGMFCIQSLPVCISVFDKF